MRWTWMAVAVGLVASPAFAQRGLQLLQAMDANGDGAITRAEARSARAAMFERLDADRDGYLSASERTNGQAQMRRGLEGADANDDGRISLTELMDQPYPGFDRLDRDNDDVVSADEIEAVRGLMQSRS